MAGHDATNVPANGGDQWSTIGGRRHEACAGAANARTIGGGGVRGAVDDRQRNVATAAPSTAGARCVAWYSSATASAVPRSSPSCLAPSTNADSKTPSCPGSSGTALAMAVTQEIPTQAAIPGCAPIDAKQSQIITAHSRFAAARAVAWRWSPRSTRSGACGARVRAKGPRDLPVSTGFAPAGAVEKLTATVSGGGVVW